MIGTGHTGVSGIAQVSGFRAPEIHLWAELSWEGWHIERLAHR